MSDAGNESVAEEHCKKRNRESDSQTLLAPPYSAKKRTKRTYQSVVGKPDIPSPTRTTHSGVFGERSSDQGGDVADHGVGTGRRKVQQNTPVAFSNNQTAAPCFPPLHPSATKTKPPREEISFFRDISAPLSLTLVTNPFFVQNAFGLCQPLPSLKPLIDRSNEQFYHYLGSYDSGSLSPAAGINTTKNGSTYPAGGACSPQQNRLDMFPERNVHKDSPESRGECSVNRRDVINRMSGDPGAATSSGRSVRWGSEARPERRPFSGSASLDDGRDGFGVPPRTRNRSNEVTADTSQQCFTDIIRDGCDLITLQNDRDGDRYSARSWMDMDSNRQNMLAIETLGYTDTNIVLSFALSTY